MAAQANPYTFPASRHYFEEQTDGNNLSSDDESAQNEIEGSDRVQKEPENVEPNEEKNEPKAVRPNSSNQFETKINEKETDKEEEEEEEEEDTLNDADNDCSKQDSLKEEYRSTKEELSSSTDEETKQSRLRMDPNYVWLLKDLALSNQKRVIDVTDMLPKQEEKEGKEEEEEEEIKEVDEEQERQQNDELNLSKNNQQASEMNNRSDLSDEEDVNKSDPNESKESHKSEENEHDDHNYINKLYEKLVKPSQKINLLPTFDYATTTTTAKSENDSYFEQEDENEGDCIGNQTGEFTQNNPEYVEWSKNYHEQQEHKKALVDDTITRKKANFSKSFEVSIEDMDNLIDRVDNGIKLKRNKNVDNENVVDSLKQEWTTMFQKLEHDYQQKLDEQQKLNDQKLKSFQEEIKRSIVEQQQQFLKQQMHKEKDESSAEVHAAAEDGLSSASSTQSQSQQNQSHASTVSYVENAKYIASVRSELKAKHERHIQDLKDYYEKELDDLRRELSAFKSKQAFEEKELDRKSHLLESHENMIKEYELEKSKHDQLTKEFNELKASHDLIAENFHQASHHVKYLTNENNELSRKCSQFESSLKKSNEKIESLEECCGRLGAQLTDSAKVQEKYIRELNVEKRNLVKKSDECDDLKEKLKFYEQKSDNLEVKLDEKESSIALLKSKLVQTEADLNRIDYEYQKLKHSTRSNQAPYLTSPVVAEVSKQKSQANLELPIQRSKSQNFRASPCTNANTESVGCSSSNFRSVSPNENKYTASTNSAGSSRQQLPIHYANSSSPLSNRLNLMTKHFGSSNDEETTDVYSENRTKSRAQATFNNGPKSTDYSTSSSTMSTARHHYHHPQQQQQQQQPNGARQTITTQKEEHLYSNAGQHSPFSSTNNNQTSFNSLSPRKQIEYIENIQHEFDLLMNQKKELDALLIRIPCKKAGSAHTNLNPYRERVEEELDLVEKKLAKVKLELRKLKII